MRVWALASGSSGNSYLIESEGTRLLVECGRPFREMLRYLDHCGVNPSDLDGILLTHAHGDHSRAARQLSDEYQLPVYASTGTLGAESLRDSQHGRPVRAGTPFQVGEVEIRSFAVPHDCYEPLGFRFEAHSGRVCITTDLGWVPDTAQAHFLDVDLLVLESNYDPMLLRNGPYPRFLQARISGSRGHLANEAAGAAIAACGDRAPRRVWLAHLSEKNNTPGHAMNTVGATLRTHGLGHISLQAARHRKPSLRWSSDSLEEQLPLF